MRAIWGQVRCCDDDDDDLTLPSLLFAIDLVYSSFLSLASFPFSCFSLLLLPCFSIFSLPSFLSFLLHSACLSVFSICAHVRVHFLFFLQAVSRELLSVDQTDLSPASSSSSSSSSSALVGRVSMSALLSNANFNQKRLTLILLINHRLVENLAIKKLIETLYAPFLPRNTHPYDGAGAGAGAGAGG